MLAIQSQRIRDCGNFANPGGDKPDPLVMAEDFLRARDGRRYSEEGPSLLPWQSRKEIEKDQPFPVSRFLCVSMTENGARARRKAAGLQAE